MCKQVIFTKGLVYTNNREGLKEICRTYMDDYKEFIGGGIVFKVYDKCMDEVVDLLTSVLSDNDEVVLVINDLITGESRELCI